MSDLSSQNTIAASKEDSPLWLKQKKLIKVLAYSVLGRWQEDFGKDPHDKHRRKLCREGSKGVHRREQTSGLNENRWTANIWGIPNPHHVLICYTTGTWIFINKSPICSKFRCPKLHRLWMDKGKVSFGVHANTIHKVPMNEGLVRYYSCPRHWLDLALIYSWAVIHGWNIADTA